VPTTGKQQCGGRYAALIGPVQAIFLTGEFSCVFLVSFIPQSLVTGQVIGQDGQAVAYLTRELRLRASDALCLFNGEDGGFAARLLEVGRRTVSIEVGEFSLREVEYHHSCLYGNNDIGDGLSMLPGTSMLCYLH